MSRALGPLALAASVALAAAVACTARVSKPTAGAGADADGPAEPSTPDADGGGSCGLPPSPADFALPTTLSVPTGALTATSGTASCANGGRFHWTLRDLDGDLQPDLVVDSACDDATVGDLVWRVYPNVGSGFGAPIRFALPQPALDPQCFAWTLVDADGDRRPDVVVTSSCTDATVGTTRWLVLPNTGAGFGAAVPFALPANFASGAFAALESDAPACSPGPRPAYAFFDVDGDAKPDLVMTATCDDASIGTTAWRVHKNVGGGVAAQPTRLALPTKPAVSIGAFTSPTGSAGACGAGRFVPRWSLVDLDGDLTPDLVVTGVCADPTVGATSWLFYRNAEGSFADAPARIAMPVIVGAPAAPFASLSSEPSCANANNANANANGQPGYALVDVDGDLRRDLLVTRACGDVTTGVTRWLVYRNTGGAFATTPTPFTLPALLGATAASPLGLSGAASCAATPRPTFTSGYLARGRFDIVVTAACHDPTVGTSRWQIYEASCP